MSLATRDVSTVFMDDEPTHYLDIKLSKDGSHLIITSATKEDSEVWCLSQADPTPQLLVKRMPGNQVSIEHVQDFFLKISNEDGLFKLLTLKDEHITDRNEQW